MSGEFCETCDSALDGDNREARCFDCGARICGRCNQSNDPPLCPVCFEERAVVFDRELFLAANP